MKTISVHLPDALEDSLDAYAETESLDRDTAVRKLLAERLTRWRQEKAVTRLRNGEVTFARAAEIAEMNVWDFADLLAERGVEWVSASHLETEIDVLGDGR